ncbi:MAG: helix-turn-helix domain-containing protein, partial [Pseudomonadota bacterium]
FLSLIAEQWGEPTRALSDNAIQDLQQHNYSGNVRELFNVLQRAVTLCEQETIDSEDLQLDRTQLNSNGPLSGNPEEHGLDNYMGNIEKRILESALKDSRYNKTEAARRLGITFRSLRYKLDKYSIE